MTNERVAEARVLLAELGFDAERSNERSAMTFLALLNLRPDQPWHEASNPMLGTRALMDFIRDFYGTDYAANSRETVRRFTLHQFVEAALVEENADKPDRPTNSPKWNYRITVEALDCVRAYGSDDWEEARDEYLSRQPGLVEHFAARREVVRIPIRLANGDVVTLSPGGQNVLLRAMVEEFCPQFVPGGVVLYLGDADAKWAYGEEEELAALGVSLEHHGKMPDLIVWDRERNWLFLMEACSSHGPVDGTRHRELQRLFGQSSAGLVFVSCFPTRAVMRKYLAALAWETEAWTADAPEHLIHLNGSRFLGPYQ